MCDLRSLVVPPPPKIILPTEAEQKQIAGEAKVLTRRAFGGVLAGAAVAATSAPLLLATPAAHAQPPAPQNAWRYCAKCEALFYDGFPSKGRCAKGGAHEARAGLGYEYYLPHDVAPTATTQNAWRFCTKCNAMFYDGYADKGKCAAGGGHTAAGFNFVLPHDLPTVGANQSTWRYCGKCHVMFFDGFADKGGCAAGGGHSAAGYVFVLPYLTAKPLPTQLDFDVSPIVFPTGTAAGGWSHLTIKSDGSYHYTGHLHDSGALGYKAASAWMVRSPSGIGYAFAASGSMAGTTSIFSSDSRDWNWDLKGVNNEMKAGWADIAKGSRAECRSRVDVNIPEIISTVKQAVEIVGQVIKVIQVIAAS